MTTQPLYGLHVQWKRPALTLMVVLLFSASVHAGFEECPQFFAQGKPPVVQSKPMQRELCYSAFAILHSGVTKTPVFVAQRLNKNQVASFHEKRNGKFYAEARLRSAERSNLDDYKGSGYSRGHMAPAGDMQNATAMAQSFSLANVVPQDQSHNSGPWSKVERDTRKYVSRARGNVFVITGPVFGADAAEIGRGRVKVPQYIYKLIYDEETSRAWAHWHENRSGKQYARPISYQELVERTGINFLPAGLVK